MVKPRERGKNRKPVFPLTSEASEPILTRPKPVELVSLDLRMCKPENEVGALPTSQPHFLKYPRSRQRTD